MSYYEPQTAKKVFLYRNGTVNKDAKLLVVNDRQVRDFSTFLNRVTSGIRAPVAVRNIYTPSQGHKIHSLEDLVSGKYYVAGGSEQFKRVKYGSGPKLLPRRQQRVEPGHHAVVAEARYKRPVEKPFVIHVFRNGDELFRGVRVLLPRRIMASWEHILEIVTDKADLYTPAKKLCTLDGQVVTELRDGGKYVAIEGSKTFRRVAYCATHTTAARRRRNTALTVPIITRRWMKQSSRAPPSIPPHNTTTTTARPQPPPVDPMSTLVVPQHRKLRPMAGRKNKEARERALLENRDDSVFGGSPVMQRHAHMPSPPPSANILQEMSAAKGQSVREEWKSGERDGDKGNFSHRKEDLGSDFIPGGVGRGTEGKEVVQETEIERRKGRGGLEGEILIQQRSDVLRNPSTLTQALTSPALYVTTEPDSDSGEERGTYVPMEGDAARSSPLLEERIEEVEDERGDREIEEEESGRGRGRGRGRGDVKDDGKGSGRETGSDIVDEREGAVEGQVEMDIIPEEEEVEQNVDLTDPEEVPEEEEGVAERSEVKEDGEEVEMKMLPQDLELESQPLQTSIDLTINRKQQLTAANEGGNPLQSDPARSSSADVGQVETEGGGVGSVNGEDVRAGCGEGEGRKVGTPAGLGLGNISGMGARTEDGRAADSQDVRTEEERGEGEGGGREGGGEGEGEREGVGGGEEDGEGEEGGKGEGRREGEEGEEGVVHSEDKREPSEQPHTQLDDRQEQSITDPPHTEDTQSPPHPPSTSPSHQSTPPPSHPPSEHMLIVEDSPQ